MLYRNTKTGVTVRVVSELKGNWVRVDGGKVEKPAAAAPAVPVIEEKPTKTVKKTTRRTKKSN